MNPKTFIIAEAGVNHNGSLKMALEMIDVAAKAGADAVKFQTFKAERLVSRHAPMAEYQKMAGVKASGQLEMLRELELDKRAHDKLLNACSRRGIDFLSSPFDRESADFLCSLGLDTLKIPSGEITNLPFLRHVGKLRKRLIISTGMADLGEIEDALEAITDAGTPLGDVTVLHCTTEYPVPLKNVNLRALETMREAFPGVVIGYSDHTEGIEIAIAAVAMGATVIEKHFTLDRDFPGPDHRASLDPGELDSLVKAIRRIEIALGDGRKIPSEMEEKNRIAARKSIMAAKKIRKGEVFTPENLTVKRPGNGVSPMRWDEIIGSVAQKNYEPDELL